MMDYQSQQQQQQVQYSLQMTPNQDAFLTNNKTNASVWLPPSAAPWTLEVSQDGRPYVQNTMEAIWVADLGAKMPEAPC
eukprot:3558724-Alexandrium_andersonii.AAC.1